VKARAERLVHELPELGVDAMLVTALVNVRYLTGYTGSNGLAVVGPRTRAFVTDFRYVEQAAVEVHASFRRVRATLDLSEAIEATLPDGPLRLGFEESHVTVRQYARLRELLDDRIELVGVDGAVERLRARKDPSEIAKIRAAAQVADEAFRALLEQGLVGRTEREAALALEQEMRARGALRPSFETIVAAGPHGALPHAQPREVPIAPGELVVIDWGAELGGYCSDCTRTVATGTIGGDALRTYELVLEAQLAGLGAVRVGAGGQDVDAVARAVIEAGGYGEEFGHGLGHGVGMAVHEAPRLGQRSEDVLAAGNVVTVEPGIYLPGRFGIRIEDLVVVTEDGPEVLTQIPKTLVTSD
jgi:Xaa-Pro aminopeptidase